MNVKIEESWQNVLQDEFEKPYFKNLVSFVKDEYTTQKVYPGGNQIFNAFQKCPFDEVKVVILGQDPYHGPNQANGLAFSVSDQVRIPPSLLNVFKEIKNDIGKEMPATGNLERWAEQGVLLLNATLTVQAGKAGSHQKKGWEEFTDAVVQKVNDLKENVVFMLWGAYAQKKGAFIDEEKHLVLKAAHPSPFAADRGFFGSHHFSKANKYLEEHGKDPIEW
ncbi:uracil-DNA glycosylase [Pontibacter diazotrophicus]|uniref:Uracil-DNA glycosylase n=1 Tax=Pontibacter diazotrophicus TaxID=1400979 RepID=A0A3D8LG46_9BACT|nr:uracil-DNA glycosylase [Pontibacter diazotrophicus]RDV16411.1 uracil-DNA glycosylase [Pontibacter diazotrophicus]